MKVVPDLAESWDTPDPVTYVFHLRHGVKFHDGRLLTSADVKYTFDSILSGAIKTPKRGSFKLVKSVEAPDECDGGVSFERALCVAAVEFNGAGNWDCAARGWGGDVAASDRDGAVSVCERYYG